MGCAGSAALQGQESSGPKAFDELEVVEYEWRRWGFITRGHWRSQVTPERKKLSIWLPDHAFGENGRARFTALIGPLCKQMPTNDDPSYVILKVHSTMSKANRTYLGVGSTDSKLGTVPGGLNGIGFAVHGQGGFDHEGDCTVKWNKERKPTFGGWGEWTDYIGVGVNPKKGTVVLATKMGPGKKTTKVYDVNWGSITLPPNWFFAIGAFLDNSQRSGYDKPPEGLTCEILSAGPGDLLKEAASLFKAELVDPRLATSSSRPVRTMDDIPQKKIEIRLGNVPGIVSLGAPAAPASNQMVKDYDQAPPTYEDAPPPPGYNDAPPSYDN